MEKSPLQFIALLFINLLALSAFQLSNNAAKQNQQPQVGTTGGEKTLTLRNLQILGL